MKKIMISVPVLVYLLGLGASAHAQNMYWGSAGFAPAPANALNLTVGADIGSKGKLVLGAEASVLATNSQRAGDVGLLMGRTVGNDNTVVYLKGGAGGLGKMMSVGVIYLPRGDVGLRAGVEKHERQLAGRSTFGTVSIFTLF